MKQIKNFFLEGESPTLIMYEFFSKYNRTGVLKQVFKTKCILKFRKYRSRKKVRFGGVKIGKINNIEKTEDLIAQY